MNDKTLEQICSSLGHFEKPKGRGSELLDRTFIPDRCPLEPGDVVPALMSQELGGGMAWQIGDDVFLE